jgi:ABC-type multidrug transport system permease subunit
LVSTIENLRGNISPYYRIVTRDADEARRLVDAGRLHMMITVPADFDARIAAGETPEIATRVFNINTDMTKNARFRLERAMQDFLAAQNQAPVTVEQFTVRDNDVLRSAFIAGGAVIIALMVGAALNTAIIVAREWERSTLKEIRLAPGGISALVTGKLLVGLVATAANVTVALIAAVLIFRLDIPADRWLPLLGFGLLVGIAAAGLGMAVGAIFHDYRILQPVLLVLAAGSFFAAGGYGSAATLPPAVRAFDVYWLPAYVFETMQGMMHRAALPDVSGLIVPLLLTAVIGVALGAWSLRRALVRA